MENNFPASLLLLWPIYLLEHIPENSEMELEVCTGSGGIDEPLLHL